MQEVYDFLKNVGTYFLATEDGDQARVRPFGTIDLFEDKLYIQTGKSKDVYKQIVSTGCALPPRSCPTIASSPRSTCLTITRACVACTTKMMTKPSCCT